LKPLVARLAPDSRLTGTAFDYALRFFVELLNPGAQRGPWIAERFVRYVENCIASQQSIDLESGKVWADGRLHRVYAPDPVPEATLANLQSSLAWAKDQYRHYLGTGIPTQQLMQACCVLAKFDWMCRAQFTTGCHVNLGLLDEEPAVVRELLQLLALVRSHQFLAETRCILNPVFRAGNLVSGADADLLIDDRLIEIKVSERRRPDIRDWDQLIGYYGLYRVSGINGLDRRVKIRRLGIYSARFATYYEIGLQGKEAATNAFAAWFAGRLR